MDPRSPFLAHVTGRKKIKWVFQLMWFFVHVVGSKDVASLSRVGNFLGVQLHGKLVGMSGKVLELKVLAMCKTHGVRLPLVP